MNEILVGYMYRNAWKHCRESWEESSGMVIQPDRRKQCQDKQKIGVKEKRGKKIWCEKREWESEAMFLLM